MEEKRDLRVQKTYDGLIAAFQELLAEKSFEKITVKELCAREPQLSTHTSATSTISFPLW